MARAIERQADWEMNVRVLRGSSFENLMKGKLLGAYVQNSTALNEGALRKGCLRIETLPGLAGQECQFQTTKLVNQDQHFFFKWGQALV
jgi:hypothetical protein